MAYFVWLPLTVVFFYFSLIFWRYSRTPIRPFIFRKRGEARYIESEGTTQDSLSDDIAQDIDGFVKSVNDTNRIRYRVAALGFLIAGVNALVTIFFL
jgi:type IV secretory pathway TrbF-like protein